MEYSGLEMSMNRQGMFRARHYDQFDDGTFTTQDMLQFEFCPYCGKRFADRRNTIWESLLDYTICVDVGIVNKVVAMDVVILII